jgi:purine-nucleoside phosphorylase
VSDCVPIVAVAFALPVESSDFVRSLAKPVVQGDRNVRGQIHGRPIVIVHTGVGEKCCRARIEEILSQSEFKYLISAGFAGALDARLETGDLLIAENFTSPELLRSPKIETVEAKWLVAKMVTAPKIVTSKAERDHWAATTGAAAVDMETEFIAAACSAYGTPLLSLRAISDTASEPLPAPPEVLFDIARQRTDFGRLGRYLVTHPQSIKSLITFRQRIALARRSLTMALDRLLRVELI